MDRDLQSIQEVRRLLEKAAEAQKTLEHFSQEQIDAVVRACAEAGRRNAEPLARLAVEETTYGVVEDKVVKNLFSAQDVYAAIKDLKTVGVIREDAANGIVEIAVPAGVVAAIIPTTNPTSTAIFKALISLKARNAVVMSPHPNAVRCISETVRVLEEAARQAGAPEGALGCLSVVTNEATQELMHHPLTAIILATGGTGLVRAAYSSGKPALGVGPGNVPAYIHASARVPKAVADILTGKCFDNGTLCSSEQHMVVEAAVAAEVKQETSRQGGFFLTAEQAAAVAGVLILPNFRVNSKMVGQSAEKIARGGVRRSAGHARADGPAGRHRAELSALGRKAFSGAFVLRGQGHPRGHRSVRAPVALWRHGAHHVHSRDRRPRDPRVRAEVAGFPHGRQLARFLRLGGLYHQALSFHVARLRDTRK
jgi:acetaldehyde dehydrogenase (acetylating)